jgi:hypothetical protein
VKNGSLKRKQMAKRIKDKRRKQRQDLSINLVGSFHQEMSLVFPELDRMLQAGHFPSISCYELIRKAG